MLILARLRAVAVPLLLHCAAGAASAYFVWHASNGQRGLKTSLEYEKQIADLQTDLDRLKTERTRWNRRISLVRGDTMDRDVLEEEARLILGRAHKYDVVVLDGAPREAKPAP